MSRLTQAMRLLWLAMFLSACVGVEGVAGDRTEPDPGETATTAETPGAGYGPTPSRSASSLDPGGVDTGCGWAVEELAAVIGEPVEVEPSEGGRCAFDVAGGAVGWESVCAETREQALTIWGLTEADVSPATDRLIVVQRHGVDHKEAYTFSAGIANTVLWENWESHGIPGFTYGDSLEAIARIARAHPSPSLGTVTSYPCPPPYRSAP